MLLFSDRSVHDSFAVSLVSRQLRVERGLESHYSSEKKTGDKSVTRVNALFYVQGGKLGNAIG